MEQTHASDEAYPVEAEPAAVVRQCAYCLAAYLSLLSARLDFVVSHLKDQPGMQNMHSC